MNASNHYFSLLSFKGQKIENRFKSYKAKGIIEPNADAFFDDLICYFDNPDLISVEEFYEYDIETLLPYLKVCHLDYLETQIPVIFSTLEEAIKLNGENHIFSSQAPEVFSKFFNELENHIALEEEKLYPYALAIENNLIVDNLEYSTRQFAIDHKAHHLKFADLINYVTQHAGDFTSNFAFTQLQKQLYELKQDLDLHELLEDKVLIPKLAELEQRLGLAQ